MPLLSVFWPAPFGMMAFTVKSLMEAVPLLFHRCDMACAYTHGARFSGFMHLRFHGTGLAALMHLRAWVLLAKQSAPPQQ